MPEEEGQEPVEEGQEPEVDLDLEGGEEDPTPEPAKTSQWREALPDELQGLSEEQLGPTLATVWQTMQAQGEQLKAMREMGSPAHARPTEPEEPDPDEDVDLNELIFDDVEKAVEIAVRRKFGGMIGNLQTGSAAAVWMDARSRLPGFKAREGKVKELLQNRGLNPDQVNPTVLESAYQQVVGQEYIDNMGRKRTKQPKSERPTPNREKEEGTKREFENETERAIFEGSGLSEEEYWDLRDEDAMEVDVPTG